MNKKTLFPILLVLAACGGGTETDAPNAPPAESNATEAYVWATNVGGDAYTGVDGVEYEAESSVSGGMPGTMDVVKGSQDPTLYRTFRQGDVRVDKSLPNGTYDVTLFFAEHDSIGAGERVFDVIVNGENRIPELDVMLWRDGKVISGLKVTTGAVDVTDGMLQVRFEPGIGDPVLSAVVVRERVPMSDDWELVWGDEFDYEGVPDPAGPGRTPAPPRSPPPIATTRRWTAPS